MPLRFPLLLSLCALALAPSAARADDAVIAREIDAALLRLADRDALEPGSIRRPARTHYELGAVLDVRVPDPRGLPVLAITPHGAAERIGLRRGDRLLRINGVAIAAAQRPAVAMKQALAAENGRARLDVRRVNRAIALAGTADRIVLPAYALSIGASTAQAPSGRDCGRLSTFDAMPRSERRFPVVIIAIDGRTPPSDDEIIRLPAGRHQVLLAERIDSDRFTTVQLKQRDALGRRAYKLLELDVASDTTYLLAASLAQQPADRMAAGAYWSPLIHRTSKETCR